jgi:hypothetical protein
MILHASPAVQIMRSLHCMISLLPKHHARGRIAGASGGGTKWRQPQPLQARYKQQHTLHTSHVTRQTSVTHLIAASLGLPPFKCGGGHSRLRDVPEQCQCVSRDRDGTSTRQRDKGNMRIGAMHRNKRCWCWSTHLVLVNKSRGCTPPPTPCLTTLPLLNAPLCSGRAAST